MFLKRGNPNPLGVPLFQHFPGRVGTIGYARRELLEEIIRANADGQL
jgi:hypothetical protein